MGPNNKNIDAIKQQTGTRIRIPPLSVKDDVTIVITGEKEGVAEAKKAVAAIYEECKANIKDTSMQVRDRASHFMFLISFSKPVLCMSIRRTEFGFEFIIVLFRFPRININTSLVAVVRPCKTCSRRPVSGSRLVSAKFSMN